MDKIFNHIDLNVLNPIFLGEETPYFVSNYSTPPGLVSHIDTYKLFNSSVNNSLLDDQVGRSKLQLTNFLFSESSGYIRDIENSANRSLSFDGLDDFATLQNFPDLDNFTLFLIRKFNSDGYSIYLKDLFEERKSDTSLLIKVKGNENTIEYSDFKLLICDGESACLGMNNIETSTPVTQGTTSLSSPCLFGSNGSSYCSFNLWCFEVYNRVLSAQEKVNVAQRLAFYHKFYTGFDLT